MFRSCSRRLAQLAISALTALTTSALTVQEAQARAGLSAPTVATFDTRASSLGFSWLEGTVEGGHLRYGTYWTSFSSTTGRLSSQFGLHYLGFGNRTSSGHGLAGSVTAQYQIPLAGRQPNGLPWVALAPYGGVSPSGIVTSDFANVSLPMHVGLGIPVSPLPWLTLTPWGEISWGGSLDLSVNRAKLNELENAEEPPKDLDPADFVRYQLQEMTTGRFGMQVGLHLGQRVDLQLQAAAHWLRDGAPGQLVPVYGATFLWHWDEVVPAVLPNHGCPPPADPSASTM